MITVLALDPTSLTLNVELNFLASTSNGESLLEVFQHAYDGNTNALRKSLVGIEDQPFRARAAHFATSVWHEKRHFLDFLSTNYGALRIRQYFAVYENYYRLIAGARENGNVLWAPLTVYLDEVHRELKGISSAWPQDLAEMFLASGRLFANDQELVDGFSGERYDLGGDAQFEALAWMFQGGVSPILLGRDLAVEAQRDSALFGSEQLRYRWVERLAHSLGIVPKAVDDEVAYLDMSFIAPLLYGSLQVRAFGQTQEKPQSLRSSTPSARLSQIVHEIRESKISCRELNIIESWEFVNSICSKCWGRTAMEEIREDYEREELFLQGLEASEYTPSQAKVCFADYHRLRGRLIQTLNDAPELIFDPQSFSDQLLHDLQPLPILFNSAGMDGNVPDGFDLIHGVYDKDQDPATGWWWANSPRTWPVHSESSIGLTERNSWLSIARDFAPMAKILLNGRAHRTMIGPELLLVEETLAAADVELRIDPQFAYPREDPIHQMETYYILSGKNSLICDFCRSQMIKPEGRFLQPWFFRHSDLLGRTAIVTLTPAGASEEVGRRRFWKDWTAWACCDACFESLSQNAEFHAACDATFT